MKNLVLFHAALADENRLRLLHLIRGGEVCVCHLQGVLQTNQPKVSRHLAYLRKAGLVAARQEGKWSYYRLKKLGAPLDGILAGILDFLQTNSEMAKDRRRLKRMRCGSGPG